MNVLSNSRYIPDLCGFIEFLEAEHPEHVVRITKELDPKFGVSGILERLERDGASRWSSSRTSKARDFRWSRTCTPALNGCVWDSAWNGAA